MSKKRITQVSLQVLITGTTIGFTFETFEQNVGEALRKYLTRNFPNWQHATYMLPSGASGQTWNYPSK